MSNISSKYKVLVVGCGNMGTSHAKAYHQMEEFEIVGLVSRSPGSREKLSATLGGLPMFGDYKTALEKTKPDVVSINTYPDTHAEYAQLALEHNAHIFIEKPLATTVEAAEELIALAKKKNRKIVVGYILRVHPTWTAFVKQARQLGKPLVMRMNLNQQSSGEQWMTHKNLMQSMSPIVDCGVHYVDIMCMMTQSKPMSVHAIGAKLTDEVATTMYNYGQLQVKFEDGSIGWYEAGWGPMMSETAFFVKDVIGPKGAVSIVESDKGASDDIDGHSKVGTLRIHHAKLNAQGQFERKDDLITAENEPDHDALCLLEQQYLLKAIQEDLDLSDHTQDAVNSLKIVLAADESYRTGDVVML